MAIPFVSPANHADVVRPRGRLRGNGGKLVGLVIVVNVSGQLGAVSFFRPSRGLPGLRRSVLGLV